MIGLINSKQTKRCLRCGEVKSVLEFHKNVASKNGLNKWCKKCVNAYSKNRYELNKEKIRIRQKSKPYREKSLKWCRKTKLTINGKTICGLNKRVWTDYCELCGKINKRLHYHHWDNKNLSKGIWICTQCHRMVGAYEKSNLAYLQRYLRLKRFLDKQFKIKEEIKPENN